MNRSLRILLAVWLLLAGNAIADPPAEPEAARTARIAERDALWNKAQAADSLAEAGATLEAALAIEKELFGEADEQLVKTLTALAKINVAAEDFTAAKRFRQQAIDVELKLHAPDDWRVRDARLALQDTVTLERLKPEERDVLRQADGLTRDFVKLYQQGEYAEAIPLAAEAVELRKSVLGERNAGHADGLNLLALLYRATDDYARAEPLYLQALEIRKQVLGEKHPDYAVSLNNLAGLYSATGDYARAEPLYRQASDLWKEILGAEHPDYATSLNNLALLYRAMGDYARAEPLLLQAAEINEQALGPQHPGYATDLNSLAALYATMGDYARAEPLYRQTLAIRKAVLGEQHPDYATSLSNLGLLYDSMGDFARAEPLYRQAIEIRKEVLGEKHLDYATSLNNLALLYQAMGDYARAEPLFRQALEVMTEAVGEQHPSFAAELNNLAELLSLMGDHARAEPLYRRALEIRKRLLGEKHPDYAASLHNLAVLYKALGDYARAEPLYRQASQIDRLALGDNHPDYATGVNNLALLYQAMGDYAQAEPLFRQANEIRKQALGPKHPDYAGGLRDLALLYDAEGDTTRAVALANTAVEIELESLEHTADAQSTRQQLVMLSEARQALDVLLSISGRADQNELAWQQVLAWKGSVAARQRALHALADRPDLVGQWAELQSVTARLARQSRATPPPEEAEAWRRQVGLLSEQAETLQRSLAEKSKSYRQAKEPITLERLRTALPADAVLIDYLEYWHTESPAQDKPGDFRSERRWVAFVLKHEGAIARFELGPVAPIAAAIDTWRTTWGLGKQGAIAAATLREKLWAPIEPSLAKAKLVLVSPDGVLGKLPLAGLPGKDPAHYLLEDFPIAMIGAPQELVWIAAETGENQRAGKLLVLGDVDYRSRSTTEPSAPPFENADLPAGDQRGVAPRGSSGQLLFSPLPGTVSELAIIEKLYNQAFDSKQVVVLEKQGATTLALRAAAPGNAYLHLATHGFFAPAEIRSALGRDLDEKRDGAEKLTAGQSLAGFHPGLLSGLVLAGANQPEPEDDGILTAEDVEALDLAGTRLVVLSACETGLGQAAGGEGLLGLQRAFAAAGAQTVVASLWNVDDLVTRDLMERFYTNLWTKQMGRLDALREAQLWALNQRGAGGPGKRGLRGFEPEGEGTNSKRLPPRYWAAFVLSGDWR